MTYFMSSCLGKEILHIYNIYIYIICGFQCSTRPLNSNLSLQSNMPSCRSLFLRNSKDRGGSHCGRSFCPACTCCSSASQRNWTSWKVPRVKLNTRVGTSTHPRVILKKKQKTGKKLCVFDIFFWDSTNSFCSFSGFKV